LKRKGRGEEIKKVNLMDLRTEKYWRESLLSFLKEP
jgi:hypothetical protein